MQRAGRPIMAFHSLPRERRVNLCQPYGRATQKFALSVWSDRVGLWCRSLAWATMRHGETAAGATVLSGQGAAPEE